MLKIVNCYYSKGSSTIDGKNIKWDNVVFECLSNNFINNDQMKETPVFGGKMQKVKLSRENLVKLYGGELKDLAGKDVEFYYNAAKQPIELKIIK